MGFFIFTFIFFIACLGSYSAHAIYTCAELAQAREISQYDGAKILYLTAAEYRELAVKRSFPIHTILFIRDLPLDVDLPIVAGIVTEFPLKTRFSHPENQARSLGIPIWNSAYAFHFGKEIDLQAGQFLRVKKLNSEIDLEVVRGKILPRKNKKSVLPLDFDRSPKKLVDFLEASSTPRELIGDKFGDLASLLNATPWQLPDATALTSGFFEEFIDSFGVRGVSLRILRRNMLDRLHQREISIEQMDQELAHYRLQISEAKLMAGRADVFEELLSLLKRRFPGVDFLSLRSSTDIEGILNTAGLFLSKRLQLDSAKSLEQAFREITTQMYTSRSYQIRERMGIREENLSMPLMAHQYIEPVLAHGIVRMSKLRERENVFNEIEYSLALGNQEKATNPSSTAQHLQFGKNDVVESDIAKFAQQYFLRNQISFSAKLKQLFYSTGDAEVEFVIFRNPFAESRLEIRILQFSTPIFTETSNLVLNGKIKKERIYTPRSQIVPDTVDELRKFNGFLSLQYILEKPERTLESDIRYAVVQKDQQPPEIILWLDGILHYYIQMQVQKVGFRFLAEGYVNLGQFGSLNFNPGADKRLFGLSWEQHFETFTKAIAASSKEFKGTQRFLIRYPQRQSAFTKVIEGEWTLDSKK